MPQVVEKPVTWFKTERQVRDVKEDPELLKLGESLLVRQLQPVIARTNGMLVVGHRRLGAAILVKKPTLATIITDEDLTDSQIRLIQLAENIHRAALTANETCDAFDEMLRLNPEWSARTLAENVNLDPSSVTRYLARSKCVAEVREAFSAGKIGLGDMYAISKHDGPSQQVLLAQKLSGLSRDALEQQGRKQRKGNSPSVRISRIVCQLASGVRIVSSGQEMSLDDLIEALAEAGKEARKARDQGLDAKTFQAVCKDKAKRGSSER